MRKRVVIKGMGTINPLGNDVSTFWEGLVAGRSGAGPITAYDASEQAVQIAGEVKGFDPVAYFGRRQVKRSDRVSQLAMYAADQAIADAGLSFTDNGSNPHAGIIIGTGIGGVCTLLDSYDTLLERGPNRVSALMVPMIMPNAAAGEIAIRHSLHGLSMSLASACATGTNAIGEGAERIRNGTAQIMICGGTESVMHPITLAAPVSYTHLRAHETS